MEPTEAKEICHLCNGEILHPLYIRAGKLGLIKNQGPLCNECLEKLLMSLRAKILNTTEASKLCDQHGVFPLSFSSEEYARLPDYMKELWETYGNKISSINKILDLIKSPG